MSSIVQRTYSSRSRQKQLQLPSSPPSTLSSSPPATPRPTKRPLSEMSSEENPSLFPPLKKRTQGLLPKVLSTASKSKIKTKGHIKAKANQQKTLTQLHFNIDQTTLRKCPLCDLSYIKGAEDDVALHKMHCARVQQGMEWGREEEKDGIRDGQSIILEVENDVKLTGVKEKGRIICLPADVNGKIGAKVSFFRIPMRSNPWQLKLSHLNNIMASSRRSFKPSIWHYQRLRCQAQRSKCPKLISFFSHMIK